MKKLLILKARKGVSEIFGTMMILVVTVAGAVLLSNMLSANFFAIDQTPTVEARSDSIQLMSYDSRDSVALTDIPSLDNDFNQITGGLLCTETCNVFPNRLPVNQGTEFIVLQIRNTNIQSVLVNSVSIKNVGHSWDENTINQNLDLSNDLPSGNYPEAGKFSIIPISNDLPIIQQASKEIPAGAEIRLLIKLSDQIQPDVKMGTSLPIFVNFGGSEPTKFVILSGDAKW